MSGATIGQLIIEIGSDTKGAEDGFSRLNEHVKNAGGFFSSALATMTGFVAGGAIISGVGAAWGFLKDQVGAFISDASDAERAAAQTNAVLQSTHGAAGMTAQAVGDLANKISGLSGIDDQAVQAGENMLLTFTNIGKNVFPAATQAVADMATAMNHGATPSADQLSQTSIMLGKALNDPLTGMTALHKVGVTLSDAQKEQIKHFMAVGDAAGAQGVILKELQKEFGSSAEASGNTFAGGIAKAQVSLQNIRETIGGAILPVFNGLLQGIAPIGQQFAQALPGALDTFGKVAGPIFDMLKWAAGVFVDGLKPGVEAVTKAFSGFAGGLKDIAWADVLEPVGWLAKTLGDGLANALKTVAGLFSGDATSGALNFGQAVGDLFADLNTLAKWIGANVMPVVGLLADFVTKTLVPAFAQLSEWFQKQILPTLAQLADFILKNVVPALIGLADFIVKNVVPVLERIGSIVVQNVVPALEGIWTTVQKELIPALENLWNKISPALIPAFQFLGWIVQNIVGPAISFLIGVISRVIDFIGFLIGAIGGLLGWLGNLKDAIGNGVGGAFKGLGDMMGGIWDGIVRTIKNAVNTIIDLVDGVIRSINGIKINIPHVDLPGGGSIGGGSIGFPQIPQIPRLASGGVFQTGGAALMGDQDRELAILPAGARVLNTGQTNALLGGSGGDAAPKEIVLQMDGRRMARGLLPHIVDELRLAGIRI